MSALVVLGLLGVALFAGTFALNDWGYATFGFEGWVAVSSLAGMVVGLLFVVVYAVTVGRRI